MPEYIVIGRMKHQSGNIGQWKALSASSFTSKTEAEAERDLNNEEFKEWEYRVATVDDAPLKGDALKNVGGSFEDDYIKREIRPSSDS